MNLHPGNLVFAYHGPLMYEAKILKIHRAGSSKVELLDDKEDPVKNYPKLKSLRDKDTYLLHYQGWNSKWDEWVGIERILEQNEENKILKAQLDALTARPKRGAAGGPGLAGARAQAKTAKKSKEPAPKRKKATMVVLKYDDYIKHLLVDDWQFITRDHQLVEVPARRPVTEILEDYKKAREEEVELPALLGEVLEGLEAYFNKGLHMMLLYKYENQQYFELVTNGTVSDDAPPATVYGLEHLLRLIVTMPAILADSLLDAVSMSVLVGELEHLLEWLAPRLGHYAGRYINTSPQYDALSRQ
ncbi:chromatin modification-related protein Eaf3p [Diutina catenulata]